MSNDQSLADAISKIPIFSTLAPEVLAQVTRSLKSESFPAGAKLCVEGDVGDRMFVIESGEVAVLKRREDGANMEIARLRGGGIAGEMSLFGEMVRSATLQAETPVRLWSLDYHSFDALLLKNTTMARSILAHLTRHLHRENSVVARLLGHDSDRRFRVAFFDSKPYMEEAFSGHNPHNLRVPRSGLAEQGQKGGAWVGDPDGYGALWARLCGQAEAFGAGEVEAGADELREGMVGG
jgi:CRP-like cAMP-binding protein